jgi:hypothetical protein
MQDVGQQMKKEPKKPAKHHLLNFRHRHKKDAPFSIQTTQLSQAAPAVPSAPPMPVAAPITATPSPQPAALAKPAPAVSTKPKTARQVPVFVIFVACLATGFLIAAAIAAYRPQ